MGRLGPAIRQAIESQRLHREGRQAEEQLRIQSLALDAAANGILITDSIGNIVWANPAFSEMTGYALDEVRGRNPRFLKSGHHGQPFFQDSWRTILSGKVWKGEVVNRRKDGSLYFVEQTITPVRDTSGGVSHFIAIEQDIGERKRTEESLRETNEQLQSLVRAAPLAIIILDRERVLQWNAAAERIFGWNESQVVGQMLPIVPEDEKEKFENTLKSDWRGLPQSDVKTRLMQRDGSLIDVSLWTAPLATTSRVKIVASLRLFADITERIRLEEQFRQVQKMEAMGLLAGGVAHDFNNILTVIGGFCDVALSSRARTTRPSELVEIIGPDRASSMTRQLLAFGRRQSRTPKVLDLQSPHPRHRKDAWTHPGRRSLG